MDWVARLLRRRKGKDPERAALLRRRGDELAAEGSLVEAAAAYEESIKLGEFDRAAYLKLADTYFDVYQPQDAEATLRRLVEADPGNGETYRDLIRICLRTEGQWGLIETIERGLALEKKDANYHLVKSYVAQFKYERADSGKGQPFLEEMIGAARKSIELDPSNADAHFLLAQGLTGKYFGPYGPDTSTPDQYDEVIRVLEKSLKLDPSAARAESLLGDAYSSAGRFEDAIASYERRLRLKPPDNAPQFLIARAHARLGRFQDALDATRKALEMQEGWRIRLGEHRWSIETLELIVESDADAPRLRSACLFASYASALFSNTAYHWDSPSQGDEALEACLSWYERALSYPAGEPDPLEWRAHFRAGAEYLRREMYVDAREALLKSAALRPDAYADYEVANHEYHPQPLELLAECYARTGRLEQARDALQRHVGLIRRAGEGLRERLDALEAEPAGSYPPWRLRTLSALLRSCEEYEAEAARKLAVVSGAIGGGDGEPGGLPLSL